MYPQFGLTLMLTHACNLRCTYCYTGAKFHRAMPLAIATAAIDRALNSLLRGGRLELGFFGGEPLLEAGLIETLINYARARAGRRGLRVSFAMTTNGTVTTPAAWRVMMTPDLDLSVSCDGAPAAHDLHRRTAGGRGTSDEVLATMDELVRVFREFRVVIVVRPDTVHLLPESIAFLAERGVTNIEPSLDLWATWTSSDIAELEETVACCARLWRQNLPLLAIGWFDEKAGLLAHVPTSPSPRCGFGSGEIAVAPSGRLYPCERLIGEDANNNPTALPGHALQGDDFLDMPLAASRAHPVCTSCMMDTECNTTCRCSNFVRTGDVSRPDALLCKFNQACLVETAQALNGPVPLTVRIGASYGNRTDEGR
jgi:uncharacterized protein